MRHAQPHFCSPVCRVLLFSLAAGTSGSFAAEPPGLRFDSPGVLDLSARAFKGVGLAEAPVATQTLAAETGAAILAAPAVEWDGPVVPMAGTEARCADVRGDCVRKYEAKLLAAEAAEVRRAGKRLLIKPEISAPAAFVDWNKPAARTADGDAMTHVYAGRMGTAGYHRVEVQFEHDAPGSFLVNPVNGKVAFVHNGGDIAALSPDGSRLAVVNPWSQPPYLNVARLDRSGPALELHCEAVNPRTPPHPAFKGWQGGEAFDLVLQPESGKAGSDSSVPIRMEFAEGGWVSSTPDPARLQASFGWVCRK